MATGQRKAPKTEHPVRKWICETVKASSEPMSPKELAKLHGRSISNIAYHVRVLAEAGDLRLVDTRDVRGSVEHFYEFP